MNDQMQTAREDLAFLRAVAEDRGPLPRAIGQHFVVIGLIFGLNVIYAYAGKTGLAPWPSGEDSLWGWLPATLLYLPYSFAFWFRARGYEPGPALRTFGVAWGAMVLMTLAIVASIYVAGASTGIDFVGLGLLSRWRCTAVRGPWSAPRVRAWANLSLRWAASPRR